MTMCGSSFRRGLARAGCCWFGKLGVCCTHLDAARSGGELPRLELVWYDILNESTGRVTFVFDVPHSSLVLCIYH